jgi:4-carboxymuconolactone decarboxylase
VRNDWQMLFRCGTADGAFAISRPDGYARGEGLEPEVDALVQLSALVALDAPEALCRVAVGYALEAGASAEDIVATLVAVSTIVGQARIVSAAPAIALGIGYDVDALL